MTEDQSQERFEGWAVVELFGHNREAGHVTTAYFGTAAMFRIEVPEIQAGEVIIDSHGYFDVDGATVWLESGSKVMRTAIPGKTRFVGPGAVYAINPCSESAIRKMLGAAGRIAKVLEVPAGTKELPQAEFDEDDDIPL